MKTCGQCGHQNVEEARFCVRCGASLPEAGEVYGAPAQAPAPGAAPSAAAPPGTATPPPAASPQGAAAQYTPTPSQPVAPGAGTPPAPSSPPGYPGAAQPPGYGAYPPAGAPAAPGYGMAPTPSRAAAAYPARAGEKGAMFWVGAVITLAAGLLVLFSSFMTWIKGPLGFGSVSGWDLVVNKLMRIENGFFDYGDGYPFFSGLNTVILGALILLLAVLALAARKKWPGALSIAFSFIALGMAVVNISTILRGPGGADMVSPGAGLILLVAGSLVGVVGGGMCLAG